MKEFEIGEIVQVEDGVKKCLYDAKVVSLLNKDTNYKDSNQQQHHQQKIEIKYNISGKVEFVSVDRVNRLDLSGGRPKRGVRGTTSEASTRNTNRNSNSDKTRAKKKGTPNNLFRYFSPSLASKNNCISQSESKSYNSNLDNHDKQSSDKNTKSHNGSKNRSSLASLSANVTANNNDSIHLVASNRQPKGNEQKTTITTNKRKQKPHYGHVVSSASVSNEQENESLNDSLSLQQQRPSKRCKVISSSTGNKQQQETPQTIGLQNAIVSTSTIHTPTSTTTTTTTSPSHMITTNAATKATTNGFKNNCSHDNHGISLGLIRIHSLQTTLLDLCSSIHHHQQQNLNNHHDYDDNHNNNKNNHPIIYPLFKGGILGRSKNNSNNSSNSSKSNKSHKKKENDEKVEIGIPNQENGVSRKQIIISSIVSPSIGSSLTSTSSAKSFLLDTKDKHQLLQYYKEQQMLLPSVNILPGPNVINSSRIYKFEDIVQEDDVEDNQTYHHCDDNSSSGCKMSLKNTFLLKKGMKIKLKVGDAIVFDAYQKHKPQYIYRVIAYKTIQSQEDDYKNIPTKTREKKNDFDHFSERKKIQSGQVKDLLDRTVEKCEIDNDSINIMEVDVTVTNATTNYSTSNEEDENFHTTCLTEKEREQKQDAKMKKKLRIRNNHVHDEEQSAAIDESNNMMGTSDVHIDDDGADYFMSENKTDKEDGGEDPLCLDSDDDTLNLSQDSFLGTPFELSEPKVSMNIPTDMPSMISNCLWRALNSSQPHNGFGYLMHMGNALNIIPNNTMACNFANFLKTGPVCEGIVFRDYERTELIGVYLSYLLRKMTKVEFLHKLNFIPSSWSDLEEIFSLPISFTEDMDMKMPSRANIQVLEQALQLSSTSLKLIALNLECEISFVMRKDLSSETDTDRRRQLYSKLPLIGSFLNDHVVRQSLKTVVRLATQCWVQHGHWLFGNHSKESQINNNAETSSRCAIESKSCFDSFGIIICYLSWLYCIEENIEFGHDNCCLVIKDAMMGELEKIDYALYFQSEKKKPTHVAKKKILASIKLRFVLSMDTAFSRDLQLKLGSMVGVSSELKLLDI